MASLIASLACDRASPVVQEIPAPTGDVVPCFAEWGRVAFVVNGVPVPEKTVERYAAFYKDLGVLDDAKAKARAIDEAIIPTAAAYADFRDQGRLVEWSSRVRAAHDRLRRGEDFAVVAKTASDCATKDSGGDFGTPFRRDQNLPALTEQAFRSKVGDVSDPVVTIFGAHIVKVTGKIDGSSPERDQRTGAHVLLAFDPVAVKDPRSYGERCQKLKKAAHVESVQEPFKKLIPAPYRK